MSSIYIFIFFKFTMNSNQYDSDNEVVCVKSFGEKKTKYIRKNKRDPKRHVWIAKSSESVHKSCRTHMKSLLTQFTKNCDDDSLDRFVAPILKTNSRNWADCGPSKVTYCFPSF